MATTLATVAFAVTGISAKINKAAASVFGEDLVNIGNIFGAGYMAFGGGFGGASGAEAATTAGVELSKAALDGTTAFGANSVDGAFNLADIAGSADIATEAASMAGDVVVGEAMPLFGIESETLSPLASGGQDLLNGGGGINGIELDALEQVRGVTEVAPIQTATMAGQGSAGQGAAAQVATAQQPGATAQVAAGSKAAAPLPGERSFFDKLIFDDKGNVSRGALGALEGVGKGISSASAASTLAKQKREQYGKELAEQQRRMNLRTGLRVTG